MKKVLLFVLMFSALSQIASPCDICGCSSANYFAPIPTFNKHFMSIRYSYRSFNSEIKEDKTQFSKDFYQTINLWGGARLGKKWQLFVFVPYNINQSTTDDGDRLNRGLGDLTVIGNYNILNIKSLTKDTTTVGQQLWIGGGLKFPTGKFEIDSSELISSANSQPGSGSLDFVLNLTYIYQIESWGISSNINSSLNQQANDFRFGNRINATTFIFRTIHVSKTTLSPNVGLLFEYLAPNEDHGTRVKDTGGNVLLFALGAEVRINKIGAGFNFQLPLAQNLSNMQTNTKTRGMFHITYLF